MRGALVDPSGDLRLEPEWMRVRALGTLEKEKRSRANFSVDSRLDWATDHFARRPAGVERLVWRTCPPGQKNPLGPPKPFVIWP